jgi:hypothetical protein
MKKKILELRKGKKRLSTNTWESYAGMQSKLTDKQYLLMWRVDAKQVIYIDKNNIVTGQMSERVFDTIDNTAIGETI